MKYFSLIFLLGLISCGKNESVLLPKSNVTIVKEIVDLSPVYIFFKINGRDTLAEVNRKNTIISTNWVFNIDKRLPLRIVIPEIMKLQDKKRNEKAHKNDLALNYYSYADTVSKNLAFIPFTDVYYKLENPKSGVIVYFDKRNKISVNNVLIDKDTLRVYLDEFTGNKPEKLKFHFNKDLNFDSYIQDKIFIESLKVKMDKKEEFIY